MSDDLKTVKKTLVNTHAYTMRWDTLQRIDERIDKDGNVIASAGSTLELDPGESAAINVPDNFEDPWLKEAKVGAPKKESKSGASTTETQKEG